MMSNRSSIVLLAPGWRPVFGKGRKRFEFIAEPFGAHWCVRGQNSWVPAADVAVVRRWLLRRGFKQSWDWYVLQSGEPETPCEIEPEIEIHLGREGGDLVDVCVKFALTPGCDTRWLEWARVVRELCGQWELKIVDPYECCLVDGSEVLWILESTSQWEKARASFGWPFVC